ncbi:RICIN domain-containing protein [Aquimarina pacifica]|uniref:RICIN domain-containing protein n=1 Tax=Aquimarina pacifica TaxID=1296415 RepID=UPI00046F9700|nr:RICIN domain-containing protein [Aquimarina pacifica]
MLQFKKTQIIFLASMLVALLISSCTNETFEENLSIDSVEQTAGSSKLTVSSFSGHHYVGNLEYVLGDVKQAQITNKFITTAHVDNALNGFEEMGVNGIRIAIFADGVNPNESMFTYFYNQAKARGFKIFANPAQHAGGKRIANGILSDGNGGTGPSVLGKTEAKNALVARVKAFASQYPCDWISPFNEDSAPGSIWYANQMTNIYAELYGNVNGAELIGPCTWGIPAGISVLQQSNIANYISIATTHNLGFNHNSWSAFIDNAGDLPVWDSEVNNFKKFSDLETRIDAAIDAGVNGLVLYNSWNTIDLNSGALTSHGQAFKDKIIQYYFIENKESGKRIKPYDNVNQNSLLVQVPSFWNGVYSQWELVPTNSGYFQFRNRGSRKYFRPVNNNDFSDIVSKTSFSGNGWHTQWQTIDAGDDYVFIKNRGSQKKIRSRNDNDISINSNPEAVRINQSPTSWVGDRTQWKLVPVQ